MGQSIIEINGKKYDATTGQVVIVPAKVAPKGGNIDGIVNPNSNAPKLTSAPNTLLPRVKPALTTHRAVHDISMVQSKRVGKSKTLMRSIVGKPGHKVASTVADKSPVSHSASYFSASNSNQRLATALKTPTSVQVSRFVHPAIAQQKVQPKIINNMPVHEPILHVESAPSRAPEIDFNLSKQSSPAHRFVDSQLAKVSSNQEESPFKKKPLHKRAKAKMKANKLKSFAVSTLAIMLIGGFLVYQNLPSITLALANREAGISAKIPKGIPSNFALSRNITKAPGQIVLSFNSRVDERKFTLTQVKAETTQESLKESISRLTSNQYQTYETSGITIFLSGNDRADWIDGGMRYNITGSTGFSPDQLAIIASSL